MRNCTNHIGCIMLCTLHDLFGYSSTVFLLVPDKLTKSTDFHPLFVRHLRCSDKCPLHSAESILCLGFTEMPACLLWFYDNDIDLCSVFFGGVIVAHQQELWFTCYAWSSARFHVYIQSIFVDAAVTSDPVPTKSVVARSCAHSGKLMHGWWMVLPPDGVWRSHSDLV